MNRPEAPVPGWKIVLLSQAHGNLGGIRAGIDRDKHHHLEFVAVQRDILLGPINRYVAGIEIAGCKARDIETELEGSGYEVEGIETLKAEAELGAAAMAAVGSGLLKSWTRYYTLLQKLPKASPENQEDAEPRDASPGS